MACARTGTRFLLSVALLAGAARCFAQESNAEPRGAQAAAEEVVITATQRPSDIFAVPAGVSVLTAQEIADAGIEDIKQLTRIAPSLGAINSIGESFGQLIRVRGVATSGADIGLESAVGVTVDGVPLSRPNLAIADLQGVERIEILRGPQGTLFGKNATAGVINVLTQRPIFESEYFGSLTAGNRGTGEMRLTANGVLQQHVLAGRVDALYSTTNGYLVNRETGKTYGGRRASQIRAQLLWTPAAAFDLRAIADYFHHDGTVNAPVYRVVGMTGQAIGMIGGTPLIAHPDAADLTQIDDRSPRFAKADSGGASAEANWRTNIGAVTAIASFRDSDFARSYDVDNSPADLVQDPRDGERYTTVTGEIRLQGRTGKLDHLFGGFFSEESIESRDSYRAGSGFETYMNLLAGGSIPAVTGLPLGSNFPEGSGVFDVFRQRATDFAVFTHNIYQVTERIALAGGLRYTAEAKRLESRIATDNPGCSAAVAAHGIDLSGVPDRLRGMVCIPNLDPRYDGTYESQRDESNWSGVVSLSAAISERLNAYASYSRGYKGGGFQLDRSGMNPVAPSLPQLEFRPETADSYEAGVKGSAAEGMFRSNAAIFYTRFGNYQFSYFTGLNRRTENVPELVSKGFEIETFYRPIDGLLLSGATTYQEVEFGRTGFPPALVQLQGTTAPIAPRWVVVGTATYETGIPNVGLSAFAYVGVRWQSTANVGGSGAVTPNFLQEAYSLIDARFGVGPQDMRWKIEFWAHNLFDTHAWSILNYTTLQPGSISGYVIDARSWGLTTTLRW